MKILIVDDSENIRKMIKSLFNSSINQFYECEDGETSLEACKVFCPDLVLMDVKMKNMDGLTATRLIKNKYPQIKVIMVSNYPYDDLFVESIRAGAEKLFAKEDLHLLPEFLNKLMTLN